MTSSHNDLYRPPGLLDVLRLPLIGRLLCWRWGRLALQVPLLAAAVLLVIDGFTGPQLAARNLATVAPWVHFRGFAVLVLLLAGNLFCMACPFTLPRTLAKRLSLGGRRFPRRLRNKWIAIASLFLLFVTYEALDLWASPALTAWLIVAYFVASFVLEVVFTESAFCKYICPLGTFNFVYSTLSPTQIGVYDPDVCRACAGKECINGSYSPTPLVRLDDIPGGQREVRHGPQGTPGCGTLLFAPQIESNLDCTMCLDCVRACPHDNVGLFVRQPGRELLHPPAWPKRWDVSLLVMMLAALGLVNAFGMVPPVYELQRALIKTFGIQSEWLLIGLIFGVGGLLLPTVLALLAGVLSRALTRKKLSLRHTVAAFTPAFVPLGFGVWFAHYGFHFLIAPLTIIPVIQEFLGQPGDWAAFSGAADSILIGLVQVAALVLGFLWSLALANRTAMRLYRRDAVPGLLPWALLLLALAFAAGYVFSLPMEMRGSLLMG
ncbi:MAG: FesM [Chloroflexi bacterium]|nr:FesM [Chloroflexota bacterium]